jgi:hypothetical protein
MALKPLTVFACEDDCCTVLMSLELTSESAAENYGADGTNDSCWNTSEIWESTKEEAIPHPEGHTWMNIAHRTCLLFP